MTASRRTYPAFEPASPGADDALAVVGLTVAYRVRGRDREVLHDVTFRVRRGEAYGLVGESGCGKSTVALTALAYLPRNGKIQAGRIAIAGRDVASLSADALRSMRAHSVSMVYQDPARALNPSLTIGRQVSEAFEVAGMTRADAFAAALEMLRRVRIAASPWSRRWTRIGSAMMSATFQRGLRLAYGSWKIIWMRRRKAWPDGPDSSARS